jgi:cobalt/nickel transport system ATP-binding protein
VSHHIIEATDLHFVYPDGTRALNGVSFRITHGESVAIVGANGAGKSTLLLHFNGCLMPTGGSLRVGDYPVTRETVGQIRRSVGVVFQDSDDQLFMPTVFDDVAFGPLNMGLPPDEVEKRVASALATVGSSHLAARPPYRLSEGEKKAVAIASVLSMAPAIMVMDEPSSNLDQHARRALINLLRTFEHTKVIATHDLDLAADLCERVIVLDEGSVAADDSVRNVFGNRDLLARCHLEMPLGMQRCPICSGGRSDAVDRSPGRE